MQLVSVWGKTGARRSMLLERAWAAYIDQTRPQSVEISDWTPQARTIEATRTECTSTSNQHRSEEPANTKVAHPHRISKGMEKTQEHRLGAGAAGNSKRT